MSATSFVSAIALAATMAAGVGVTSAAAQTAAMPAEFPPSSYQGTQYVDSKGCAFVRAGMDGAVNWVPRVDRFRQQLCNFKPTTGLTAAAPLPDPLPNVPIITVTAQPAPVAPQVESIPQRRPVAQPVPQQARNVPARVAAAQAPKPLSSKVISAQVVAAPAPARVTLAQACEGRFGVQPGFVSASTRQPIDCGPNPRMAAAPASGPAPLRLTLADACAKQAATGRTLINAATRQPIVCTAPVQIAMAPQIRGTMPSTTAAAACGIDGMMTDGRYPVRCGPQVLSPSGQSNRQRIVTMHHGTIVVKGIMPSATVSTSPTQPLFGAGPVPASNAASSVPQVPQGYARVWDDGRINPQRGLPKTQVVARVSSRAAVPVAVQAPAAASGHRYVQVGSFGDPANAARLIARLQAAGLPVASAKSESLKVIAAGPFRSAGDLNRALGIVRGMGFSDAYLRS